MKFIGTTCLVSETSKPRPHPRVIEFVEASSIVLPSIVITEVERGILRAATKSPERSALLRLWFTVQPDRWPLVQGRERETAKILAAMLECRALKNVWLPQPKAEHPKLAHHLFVAASAIAYDLPIAAVSTGSLSLIGESFQLPGIFNTKDNRWITPGLEALRGSRPMRLEIPSAA